VRKIYIALSAALGAIIGAMPAINAMAAPGDLLVSPVRVVFEGRDRVAEITLVNKGEKETKYRVSVENRRMKRDGSFEIIDQPEDGVRTAEKLFRYAPRRIVLAPNAPQTLRVVLRKPADLEEGEYRSHLQFAAVPEDAGTNSIEQGAEGTDDISIRLTPIYGVTIPIIVRHGAVEADAMITQANVAEGNGGNVDVSFVWKREGTMSLYGDFKIFAGDDDSPIAEAKGLALYTPNIERLVKMVISVENAARIKGRPLKIEFSDRTKSGSDISAALTVASR